MKVRQYKESELIINPDGSIFHLRLLPEHIADNVILVGDPERVDMIAGFLDAISIKVRNREFYSIKGKFRGLPVTVISTGIGTDNIDIVLNEIDALVNIDLDQRRDKPEKRQLKIFRIGTSGAIQSDIEPGSFMTSAMALGFDGLLNFYHDRDLVTDSKIEEAFVKHTGWSDRLPAPYVCKASGSLLAEFEKFTGTGITISANGFYGPQGRDLRARLAFPGLNDSLSSFRYENMRITNFEMEGSAIYGLSGILGHDALTVCLIIANRETKKFLRDYKPAMKELVENCLNTIVTISNP